MYNEPKNIGLPSIQKGRLDEIIENTDVFKMKQDLYRFAVAISIKEGIIGDKEKRDQQTMFDIGGIDPEPRIFYHIVKKKFTNEDEGVYRTIERLAASGIDFIYDNYSRSMDFSFCDYLE
jgi:hypothetical protein